MMNFGKTYELLLRKVCLEAITRKGRKRNVSVIGCERGRPVVGKPYVIYLGKDRIFKTSPIRDIKETYTALMIQTQNSIYRIKYLRSTGGVSLPAAYEQESCAFI